MALPGTWGGWLRARWFPLSFVVLLVGNLLPLTAEYLPFSDLNGHIGVASLLARWNDPVARTQAFFKPNPHPIHHSLIFEHLGALLGRVMPITIYANLFVAVTWVAAFPLSVLALLAAFRRDLRLSLLVFPFTYLVALWMGFVNYLASMPLVLLALALLRRLLDEPTAARTLLLGLVVAAVAWAHFFGALAFGGLCLLLLVVERPRPLVALRVLVTLVPAWLLLRSWKASEPFADRHKVLELLGGPRDYAALAKHFYRWTLGGLNDGRSDYVLLALAVSLALCSAWCLLRRDGDGAGRPLRVRVQPLLLFVVGVVVLFRLPLSVPGWWAVNVRMIPLVFAFALLALPAPRRPIPSLALAPAMVASLCWSLYLAWDFHHDFNGVEMAGFDQTIDAAEPGHRLLALWPPREADGHYMQYPLPYMGVMYVARRGGMADPLMNGPDCDEPVWPRYLPYAPTWGQSYLFNWVQHAKGWRYFLVQQPAPGRGYQRNNPWVYVPPSAVRLITSHGRWELWENQQEK